MDDLSPGPFVLSGVPLATALVFGQDPDLEPLPVYDDGRSPRAVLEDLLLAALRRAPCVIGFSGGRDSSALLSLAVVLARREGLPLPIPATNVFSGDVQASESEWQELVVSNLELPDWERLRFTDELDVVGPEATPLLLKYGPSFPFNGHFGMPSFRLASGGTYITGVGGDEIFEPSDQSIVALALLRSIRPRRAHVLLALRALGPQFLRARRLCSIVPEEPWLNQDVGRALVRDLADTLANQSLWFDSQIRQDIWREKSRSALQQTLSAFGETVNSTVLHPFQDGKFLDAIARDRGRAPWRSRAEAMDHLFGDVLIEKVRQRRTKAGFDSIFFNDHSRAFVQGWDGSGVDTGLVDVDALRATWLAATVDPRSLSLLQAAWVSSARR
jgi:hypothetical protein